MIEPKRTLKDINCLYEDEYKISLRLKLDLNENIYGPSEYAISALKNFNTEDIYLYPKYGQFIDKLAKKLEVNYGNIMPVSGCDEGLDLIINTYLDESDEILTFGECYMHSFLRAGILSKKTRCIDFDKEFNIDTEAIKQAFSDNTKIFYVSSPNNITGKVTRASVIAKLAEEFNNILFVVDCSYINYASDVALYDYIDLTFNLENVVILKSFSLDYALAGLRIGFILSNENNIKNLKKLSFKYGINSLALCALGASMNDNNYLEKVKELNIEARELLSEGLFELGYKVYESEANFLLCDFGEYKEFFYNKLKNNGILVKKFPNNSKAKNCLRITVPKKGGVRYVLELLKTRSLLIIDADSVLFGIKNSYLKALQKTCEIYANEDVSIEKIKEIKYIFNLNSDYEAIRRLLLEENVIVDIEQIISAFKNIYYDEKIKKDDYLIENERLIISDKILEELTKTHDLALYSSREKTEIMYLVKKYNVEKYFCYIEAGNYFETIESRKACSGIIEILNHCPYKNVKFFGAETENIVGAKSVQIDTVGVITNEIEKNAVVNNFRHLGISDIVYDVNSMPNFLKECQQMSN